MMSGFTVDSASGHGAAARDRGRMASSPPLFSKEMRDEICARLSPEAIWNTTQQLWKYRFIGDAAGYSAFVLCQSFRPLAPFARALRLLADEGVTASVSMHTLDPALYRSDEQRFLIELAEGMAARGIRGLGMRLVPSLGRLGRMALPVLCMSVGGMIAAGLGDFLTGHGRKTVEWTAGHSVLRLVDSLFLLVIGGGMTQVSRHLSDERAVPTVDDVRNPLAGLRKAAAYTLNVEQFFKENQTLLQHGLHRMSGVLDFSHFVPPVPAYAHGQPLSKAYQRSVAPSDPVSSIAFAKRHTEAEPSPGVATMPCATLTRSLQTILDRYLRECGIDQGNTTLVFNIDCGLGKKEVRIYEESLKCLRQGTLQGRELQRLGLVLFHELSARSPEEAKDLALLLDRCWGGRLAWDRSLHGLSHTSLAEFEALAPALVAAAKQGAHPLYLRVFIDPSGRFQTKLTLGQEMLTHLSAQLPLCWRDDHWEIGRPRGKHAWKLIEALEAGDLARRPLGQTRVRVHSTDIYSLMVLREQAPSFLSDHATVFLGRPPEEGDCLILSIGGGDSAQEKRRKSKTGLLLSDHFPFPGRSDRKRWGAVMLRYVGGDWEIEHGAGARYLDLQRTLVSAGLVREQKSSPWSPTRWAMIENDLGHTEDMAALLRDLQALFAAQVPPHQPIRHRLLIGEYRLDCFALLLPQSPLNGFVSPGLPHVAALTPDGPRPFIALQLQSPTGRFSASFVLYPGMGTMIYQRQYGMAYFPPRACIDVEHWLSQMAAPLRPAVEEVKGWWVRWNSLTCLGPYYFREFLLNGKGSLNAFIDTLDTLRALDPENPVTPGSLERPLRRCGYPSYGCFTLYKIYHHWKKHGFDIVAASETVEGLSSRDQINILEEEAKRIGLPEGNYTLSVRWYIYYMLLYLNKLKKPPLLLEAVALDSASAHAKRADGGTDPVDFLVRSLNDLRRRGILSPEEHALAERIMEGDDEDLNPELLKELGRKLVAHGVLQAPRGA